MRPRQKRIDFASLAIERQGVCAFFRRHDFLRAHRGNIDNVDDARIADGDIKVTGPGIKKNYIRSAAETNLTEDTARRGLDRLRFGCGVRCRCDVAPRWLGGGGALAVGAGCRPSAAGGLYCSDWNRV